MSHSATVSMWLTYQGKRYSVAASGLNYLCLAEPAALPPGAEIEFTMEVDGLPHVWRLVVLGTEGEEVRTRDL